MKIAAFADEASPMIDMQIKALKRNGLHGLEIRNVDGVNISDINIDKAAEVRKKLDDAGIFVWSIGSPIGKIDITENKFEEHIDKFKHTLELAKILGSKNIRIFSFFIPFDSNHSEYKNEVIDRLGMLCEVSRGYDIILCHENEKGIYGDNAQHCMDIHRAIPELRSVFDPANFVQCGENTIDAWNKLQQFVHYVHIKDSLLDGNIVPAGLGDGNIAYIVEKFVKSGGKNFTLEPHLAVFDGLSALERDGQVSEVGQKYKFTNNDEAFDAACSAFNSVLNSVV